MKHKAVCVSLLLIASCAASIVWAQQKAKTAAKPNDEKIVVMNPRGIQPEIRKIPMAKRPETLDGKTVYIVDTKYPNTKPFVISLQEALTAKYPKTTWVIREKAGGYMDDDPALWKEMKDKGISAGIVVLGH